MSDATRSRVGDQTCRVRPPVSRLNQAGSRNDAPHQRRDRRRPPRCAPHWWSDAIGWPVTFVAPDEVVVEPAGNGQSFDVPALVFVPVDDPKTTKNRVHLDLASDSSDHQADIVARLVAAGAAPVDVGQSDVPWVVLADPEGNEFCVLEPA